MTECAKGVENEQRIIALENDARDVKDDIRCIKERLLNCPPIWATALITALTAIVAALLARSF